MQPISYPSRDGLTIHGYLTTPRDVEPRGLPLVLVVHGGPWARDEWGYDGEAQWLANRGYAVLQVNSALAGYGKTSSKPNPRVGARCSTFIAAWNGPGPPTAERAGYTSTGGFGATPRLGARASAPVFRGGVDYVGISKLLPS